MLDLLDGKTKLDLPSPKFTEVQDFIEREVCPALREALRAGNMPIINQNQLPRPYEWRHIASNYAIFEREQRLGEGKLNAIVAERRGKALLDLLRLLEAAFVALPDQAIVACRGNWLKETVTRAVGQPNVLACYIDFTFALVPTEVARQLAKLRW